MKNIIKTVAYSTVALSSVAYTNAIRYGQEKVQGDSDIVGNTGTIEQTITNILGYLFKFLYLIAFVLIIWAGFNILTAAGDDEKVKKGKTTMIQAFIGLVVIFLADQLVQLIFSTATSGTAGTGQ